MNDALTTRPRCSQISTACFILRPRYDIRHLSPIILHPQGTRMPSSRCNVLHLSPENSKPPKTLLTMAHAIRSDVESNLA